VPFTLVHEKDRRQIKKADNTLVSVLKLNTTEKNHANNAKHSKTKLLCMV